MIEQDSQYDQVFQSFNLPPDILKYAVMILRQDPSLEPKQAVQRATDLGESRTLLNKAVSPDAAQRRELFNQAVDGKPAPEDSSAQE